MNNFMTVALIRIDVYILISAIIYQNHNHMASFYDAVVVLYSW